MSWKWVGAGILLGGLSLFSLSCQRGNGRVVTLSEAQVLSQSSLPEDSSTASQKQRTSEPRAAEQENFGQNGEPLEDADFSDGSGLVDAITIPLAREETAVENRWRAHSHPHGDQLCASGCALSRHPTPALQEEHFFELTEGYANMEAKKPSRALDELIFFGPQTIAMLRRHPSALPEEHQEFLVSELAKESLILELRVIDSERQVRVALPPTLVPQHIRQEFTMEVFELQPVVTSGTLKRVGLNHVWQRL